MKSEYLRVFELYDGKERERKSLLALFSVILFVYPFIPCPFVFSSNSANISVYFAIFLSLSLSVIFCHYLFVNHIKLAKCVRVHWQNCHDFFGDRLFLCLSFRRKWENKQPSRAGNPILVFEGFISSACRILFCLHPGWTIGSRSGSVNKKPEA